MSKLTTTLLGLAVGLVLFVAINVLANTTLRSVRADLTEDKLYTLADGSKALVAGLEDRIDLTLYFSEDVAKEVSPAIVDYYDRVRGLLEEYVRASDGKISLALVNPEPFSEEEDLAVQDGIQGVPLQTGDSLYFGLAGTNLTDDREVIPYLDFQKADEERFLEYDLSKMLWSLAHPEKKTVGVLTSLPLQGSPGNPMMGQQGPPPWGILAQLEQFFDVTFVDPSGQEPFPTGLDVLLIVHPKNLPESVLYEVDQFALGGGPVLAFVDPFCEMDGTGVDPQNPMSQFQADRTSNLKRLFDAWGVRFSTGQFVADRERAQRFPMRTQNGIIELPIVYLMGLGADDVNEEDPVTSLLTNLQFAASGALRPTPEATTTFSPLLRTTEDSAELDAGKLAFQPDPQEMLASFTPGYEQLALAARVTGSASTAFPNGKPLATEEVGTDPADADPQPRTEGSIQVILVADVDMLADRWWLREQRITQTMAIRSIVSDNATFLINAVENLSGGEELISIRARGQYSRPFDLVEKIRLEAEQEYLATARELEQRLQRIDARLRELETETGQGADELVSQAQREAIDEAIRDKVQTRKELRDVRYRLDSEIKQLGVTVKAANILAAPLAVMLFGLVMALVRYGRRQ